MAEKRLLVVKTGTNGEALIGSIPMTDFETSPLPQVRKDRRQVADLHRPEFPILLTVLEGQHSIFTHPVGRDRKTWFVDLQQGDQILFCDFTGDGHGSEAGSDGALLEPAKVLSPVDLEALGWEEGLGI